MTWTGSSLTGTGRWRAHAIILAIVVGLLPPVDAAAAFTGLPAGFEDREFLSVPAPTAIDWLPDGRILVASKGGRIFRADIDGENLTEIALPIDVCDDGERGLLGLAVNPNFAQSGHVFLYYTDSKGSGACANRVSRFTLGPGDALDDERVLIDNVASPASNHNAGDLQFDRDGLLYISVGDGGAQIGNPNQMQDENGNARRMDILNGKILRIEQDGSIPTGNPFTGAGTRRCSGTATIESESRSVRVEKHNQKHKKKQRKRKRKQKRRQNRPGPTCQEIYATGLRNPFRIAFDPDDISGPQALYINDVGGGGFEEINEAEPGADYGWNLREGPCRINSNNCARDSRFVDPIFAYRHGNSNPPFNGCTDNTTRRSITGGAFVPDSADWPAPFANAYLFADFVCGKLVALTGGEAQEFGRGSNAIHLAFGPDDALYYTTFEDGGQVHRIAYSAPD